MTTTSEVTKSPVELLLELIQAKASSHDPYLTREELWLDGYRRALADGKAKAFGVGSAVLNEFVMCEKLDALDAIAAAAENL